MPYKSARKRFGYSAIKKGFITEDQLIEAMRIQISIEQKGDYPILIGEIMKRMGFITDGQAEEILGDIPEFERYKCPVCGMLFHECPNCGADLIKLGM
jgi:rubrerythrin